eukprot:COSAG02_NODE_699_length_18369_cov_9.690203_5_plen_130_part_00
MHCAVHIGTKHRSIGTIVLAVNKGAVLVAAAKAVVIDAEQSAVVGLVVVTGWCKGTWNLDAWHIVLLNVPPIAEEYNEKNRDRHSVVRKKPADSFVEASPRDGKVEPHRACEDDNSCTRAHHSRGSCWC